MKNFKKFLKENMDREDYLDSIHQMPLEDALSHGEMELVANPGIFIEGAFASTVNPDHAFTKFLTHPEHTDQTALEHINYLLKVAHARDVSGNYQPRENPNQVGVYNFVKTRFPNIAYAISNFARQKVKARTTPPILSPIRDKNPIVITPEHLDQVKKEHYKLIHDSTRGGFINARGRYVMNSVDGGMPIHDY